MFRILRSTRPARALPALASCLLLLVAFACSRPAAAAAPAPDYLGSFSCPDCRGITVTNDGTIFVVAYDHVNRFSRDGQFLGSWMLPTPGWYEMNAAYDLVSDGAGHLFVVNEGAQRVQEFTESGTLVKEWGGYLGERGSLYDPISIARDPGGDLFVGELAKPRIQRFHSDSTLVMSLGAGWGTALGAVNQVLGMAVGPNGLLYAIEWGNRRVQVFDGTGTPLFMWGSTGAGDGQFNGPTRVAIDASGTVYVSDSDNNRVQMFGPTGTYLGQFGTFGSGNGQFRYPFGMAIDIDGNLLVVDQENNRVQRFGHLVVPARRSTWGSVKTGSR